MRATIFVAAMLAATFAATARAQDSVRVYVFTAGTNVAGFTDPGQRDREDGVAGLKAKLAGKKLAVVSEPEAADFTLEVVDRGVSKEPQGTNVWTGYKESKIATLTIKLTAGTYSAVIEGESDGRLLGTKGVAIGKAADKIETWVKENRAAVLAHRN